MRIAITTTQVPFIKGGAELMTKELFEALKLCGHEVEIITLPFRFNPAEEVSRGMDAWRKESFDFFDAGKVDKVICLKFPAFYIRHENKSIWLMHQHRAAYELFDTPYGYSSSNKNEVSLRDKILKFDKECLREAKSVFTISQRVSERMKSYCGVDSSFLYQPPPSISFLKAGEQLPYIFFPSRLETLKRQGLLIKAARYLKSPTVLLLVGEGGQRYELDLLIENENVRNRVKIIGKVTIAELANYYSNALGVFFGPYDEDYGFVTLEAMLSAKPVITCTDSGGPLEFVVDGITGSITEPDPESIAAAIDELYFDRAKAKAMGLAGLERYKELNISWSNVVEALLN
ncbi:glycosyltransferase family 4 protein [Pseudomonas luteola]|uniref:glycosyltransferase family 4 protein n=1 Tax=Pseudomonas TaxID=286 RepID=UPI001EF67D40|nr:MULTISPECIES: glycosyltransferase family 4 protein [Pseudomonas]MCG7374885.1 glycosyltransferase family 4 protein [Pseudomonas luteola]